MGSQAFAKDDFGFSYASWRCPSWPPLRRARWLQLASSHLLGGMSAKVCTGLTLSRKPTLQPLARRFD